jgi:hypothetical protein|tara:strand:+ start:639 stop:1184 length:546 start_codon:yes stop_codon:yes gene_type:complete
MAALQTFQLDSPVAGQSLTSEPGARPWENPAQMTDTLEILDEYAGLLMDPEKTNRLMEILESGFPVSDVVDSMTLAGVMNGKHSIDNAVIISPHLHDIVVELAKVYKVDYKDVGDSENKNEDVSLLASAKREDSQNIKKLEVKEKELIKNYVSAMSENSSGLMSRNNTKDVELLDTAKEEA